MTVQCAVFRDFMGSTKRNLANRLISCLATHIQFYFLTILARQDDLLEEEGNLMSTTGEIRLPLCSFVQPVEK